MEANEIKYDDLTKISGIGFARQQWLTKVFDVHSYEDLAALSVDAIIAQLKSEGKPYTKSKIELWPLEAAKLAKEKSKLIIINLKEPPASEFDRSSTNETKIEEILANRVNNGQWKPVATFIVEFQKRRIKDHAIKNRIKVSYHDTDREKLFEMAESEQILPWVIEQAGEKLDKEALLIPKAKPQIEGEVELPYPVYLPMKITNIHLYQPENKEIELTSDKNGQAYAGIIMAYQPFIAEATFKIDKKAEALIGGKKLPYRIQFFSQNRHTGEKKYLGDADPSLLFSEETDYSTKLRGLKLPQGAYRLHVVALPESKNVLPSYFELPMLRVV